MKVVLLWDEGSVEHIARHGIKPVEVEKALKGKKYTRKTTKNGKVYYEIIGDADGRILFIAIGPVEGGYKVGTAYDAEDRHKKLYKSRRM